MSNTKAQWDAYVVSEIEGITPLLTAHGFSLLPEQPHVSGERYVFQPMTTVSGKKVVLLGKQDVTGGRVVIKASSHKGGRAEIAHERQNKHLLHKLHFAYEVFATPRELFFSDTGSHTIAVYEFIASEKPFLERSLDEQFSLALSAFKAQESAHATTYRHYRTIKHAFPPYTSREYLTTFKQFKDTITTLKPETASLLTRTENTLTTHRDTIDRYGGFLTHWDFIPQNFRVHGACIFLLDFSSLRFGNKYEGWARFINFMMLYNPPLEDALVKYVRDNRSQGEQESLNLMRLYRLSELVAFYSETLPKAEEQLHTLNSARILFWLDALAAVVQGGTITDTRREEYRELRDSLRSSDEKERQRGLH